MVFVSLLSCATAKPAVPKLTTLYSFTGQNGDGASPYAGVIQGSNGTLFGTTCFGGLFGAGTVFQLTPPSGPSSTWTETVLYSFTGGVDGGYPYASVVLGSSGALYGTTNYGGTVGKGTVFELSPPGVSGGPWIETVLYSFSGPDGATPYASLVIDSHGVLYGTTELGGAWGYGTIFQLAPPKAPGAPWTETVLYSFTGLGDGAYPYAPLVMGPNGALYGTVAFGGSSGKGSAFELAPPPIPGGQWTQTLLYSFKGSDGGFPYAGPILDATGSLYGTTPGGVAAGKGTAFKLTPPAGTGPWTETLLHKFAGNADGATPHSALVLAADGTLYGTTYAGGAAKGFSGFGLVFKLALSGTTWKQTVLYTFSGAADGAYPDAGLFLSIGGLLFGTTLAGGNSGQGTIFQLAP